ncbi:MAG: DNA alkylation repair protein [Bacteroidota bacterium]
MSNDSFVSNIREELAIHGNEDTRQSAKRFFKEEIKTYGLKKPAIDKIAKTGFREIESPTREKVFEFVIQRKNIMPRTALRYAIEKMAPEKKEAAMAK